MSATLPLPLDVLRQPETHGRIAVVPPVPALTDQLRLTAAVGAPGGSMAFTVASWARAAGVLRSGARSGLWLRSAPVRICS